MLKYISLTLLLSLATVFCNGQESRNTVNSDYDHPITVPLGGKRVPSLRTRLRSHHQDRHFPLDGRKNGLPRIRAIPTGAEFINVSLRIKPQEERSRIKVKIGNTEEKVTLKKNTAGEIEVGDFKFAPGYQKIELSGLSKSGDQFARITDIILRSEEEIDPKYVRNNDNNSFYWGRRGPSVHLNYSVPEGKDYQWFYNEVTVPEGEDARGSYFMANGFAEGYFGFQVNSDTERRILFSVWSPFATDNPDEIPEEQKDRPIATQG